MKKSSKKISIDFKGQIVMSKLNPKLDRSDIKGNHQIWYPKSSRDVSNAIKILNDKKLHVRSGIQVVTNDIIDGENDFVLNLTELVKIQVKNRTIKVEPGVKSRKVADVLIKNNLIIPISDNEHKSIVSNLIFEEPSYLIRTLGSLSDYVQNIKSVKRSNGEHVNFRKIKGISSLEQSMVIDNIITQITFNAVPADSLWMYRKTLFYASMKQIQTIANEIFTNNFAPNIDIIFEVYNGQFNIPQVRISLFGNSQKGKQAAIKYINALLEKNVKNKESDIFKETAKGTEVINVMQLSETGPSYDEVIDTKRFSHTCSTIDEFSIFMKEHSATIHDGVAFSPNGLGKINKNEYVTSRIQLNKENQIQILYYVHSVNDKIEQPLFSRKKTNYLRSSFADKKLDKSIASYLSKSKLIPNFKGLLYTKKDLGYEQSSEQYASSSYDIALTKPFLIAYPIDEEDIMLVIKFAKKKGKKLVVRSGGHQYSGKSSGGKNTIMLSLDAFNKIRIIGNHAEIGPAVKLSKLACRLNNVNAIVPHGECPYVAIGGHAQTGGYGHFLRSFGILIDYIESFDIILANCKKITIIRPRLNSSIKTFNDRMFWAVLGGNAGSFGVITKFKIRLIQNSKFKNSYGFSISRKYRKSLFSDLMYEVLKWTKRVELKNLPPNMDFMMTVASSGRMPFPPLLVELVHTNLPRKRVEGSNAPKEFKSVVSKAKKGANWWEQRFKKEGYEDLSLLSDSFVRRWPSTTLDGREFRNPYKKRVNCTTKSLSKDFVDAFVDIIDRVINKERGIQLIFQISIGGGQYNTSRHSKVSSIPHRDYTFCFVFDLFYKEGYEQKAITLQNRMQKLIDSHYNDGNELRVFWGSFGDTNISEKKIREMYYPDVNTYKKLQHIKQEVDSEDLFHTSLTVELPN